MAQKTEVKTTRTKQAQKAANAPTSTMATTNTSTPYSLQSLLQMVNDNFVLLLVAVLLFAGGFFGGSLWTENKLMKSGGVAGTGGAPTVQDPTAPTGPTPEQLAALPAVDVDSEHIRGNADAEIFIVEYSDFECPYCAAFHPTTKQILDEYGDDVALVYRHYPLPFHPNAQKAAEASECIADLAGNDAFWLYADAVFAENDKLGGSLTPDSITTAAEASGVNMTAFQECLDSGEMAEVVEAQMAAGTSAGVSGTPGSFIVTADGAQELIGGALPFATVQQMINQYL